MKEAGRFSEEAFIKFWQESNFAQGQPCGGSYISAAYKCRVGTGDPSYRTEMVKELMSSSFSDYESGYGKFRDEQLDKETEAVTSRIFGKGEDEPSRDEKLALPKADHVRIKGATQTQDIVDELVWLKEKGTPEAITRMQELEREGDFFKAMKWQMQPDAALVSQGSLDLAWDGADLNKSYAKQFPGDKDAKYGQSRVGVNEHPFPTSSLKTAMIDAKPGSLREVMDFVLRRNFISVTSAPEDERFTGLGLKSALPPGGKIMGRYTEAKVKTFVLTNDVAFKNKEIGSGIMASVKTAKARGMSKEEWIASIIQLPGVEPGPSIFAK